MIWTERVMSMEIVGFATFYTIRTGTEYVGWNEDEILQESRNVLKWIIGIAPIKYKDMKNFEILFKSF